MKSLKFEEKIKKWIEKNGVKWCFILFAIGLTLGILASVLLGGDTRQSGMMGSGYGFLLVIVEITVGGSGTN